MMETKFKIGVIFLVIVLTIFIGINGVVSESESASQLLESAQSISFSTFYENFTSDKYPKYNDQLLYKNKLSNFKELEEASLYVYEVEPITRKYYEPVMQTKCRIKKVLKGDTKEQYEDDIIYIYEHYSVEKGLNSDTQLFSPIFPMKDGGRYLVFVNPIKGYNNNNHYNLVSTVYGIIPIKNSINITESDQYSIGFDPWPINAFKDSNYVVENIDEAKKALISELIASHLLDLESRKGEISLQHYQSERAQREDLYSALSYSISYKRTLMSIVSEALKTYYDINVEFVDK